MDFLTNPTIICRPFGNAKSPSTKPSLNALIFARTSSLITYPPFCNQLLIVISLLYPVIISWQLFAYLMFNQPCTINSIRFPDVICVSPHQLTLLRVILFKPALVVSEIVVHSHANKYPARTSATSIKKNTSIIKLLISAHLLPIYLPNACLDNLHS